MYGIVSYLHEGLEWGQCMSVFHTWMVRDMSIYHESLSSNAGSRHDNPRSNFDIDGTRASSHRWESLYFTTLEICRHLHEVHGRLKHQAGCGLHSDSRHMEMEFTHCS